MSRRSFLTSAGAGLAFAGSLSTVLTRSARAAVTTRRGTGSGVRPRSSDGYGELIADPNDLLDLPEGFTYRVYSRTDYDLVDGGSPVPGHHDGMAAFGASGGTTILIRNHELDVGHVAEEGVPGVVHVEGHTYNPGAAAGGTTTLVLDRDGELESATVSLAGTIRNCAGGVTPWGTWLTCEEDYVTVDGLRHGYVFEVDPVRGGDPTPIIGMGRFNHEAVAFDRLGIAYLTEDDSRPHGLLYRFRPNRPLDGRGSLHAGGELSTMRIPDLDGTDLSAVSEPGTVLDGVEWIPVDEPDLDDDETLRETYPGTPVMKAEGIWAGDDEIWFVSSYARGPDADRARHRTAAAHGGQIWRYEPDRERLELVVQFSPDDRIRHPDNITISPYGFAVMCTDNSAGRQYLAGITPDGDIFPLAFNRLSEGEFAGACFSPDGSTLFANIYDPGTTVAITGPWST